MSADFWAALALVLIFEGLVLFAIPGPWKRMVAQLAQEDDRSLQRWGGAVLIAGLLLFWWVRGGN